MLVFSKAKLVMLSVPKTGTTAYQAALEPLASMVVSDPPALKHTPVYRYHRYFQPMLEKFIGDDLEILAVIREPVSWLGSWYRYRRRDFMKGHENSSHDISFDDFVLAYTKGKRPGFADVGSQAKFIEPVGDGTAATHVFRYEDQAGITKFLESRLGITPETERHNVSPKMPLDLGKAVEAKLRRKCAQEFDLYNSIKENGVYTPPAKSGGGG